MQRRLLKQKQHVYFLVLTHSLTHSLTYSLTHSLTYLLTHLLTYSLTHSLKEDYATFHAKPLPKTTFEPGFVTVAAAPSAVTQPMSLQLESDKRALKRKEYNEMMLLKSQEIGTHCHSPTYSLT